MTDLPGLLERVMKCEGPDRGLDAALTVALTQTVVVYAKEGAEYPDDITYLRETVRDDNCAEGTYWEKSRSGASLRSARPLTASIDAALGLVERVLPGQAVAIGTMKFDPPGTPWATIWTRFGEPRFNAQGATVPMAILAAFLTALIANPDLARVKV